MKARANTLRASRLVSALTAALPLLPGCRPQSPASSPPAAGAPTSQAATQALHLRDYVVEPVVDDSERALPALRIASMAPRITEICCALGLRDYLVARTRYCTYPPGIERIPSIGALVDLNVERLLELRPDLVLVSGSSRAQTERLRALRVRVETLPDTDLDDLFVTIRRIGTLTGRPRSAARLCERIAADLRRVDQRFAGGPPQRVLVLIGPLHDPPEPPTVAGTGSFYDALLRRAGHRNAAPANQPAFAPLSLEYISQADPDVIIELDADGHGRPAGRTDALRIWSQVGPLRAVRSGRVHVLRGPQYYLLGPRIASVYADLCAAIRADRP